MKSTNTRTQKAKGVWLWRRVGLWWWITADFNMKSGIFALSWGAVSSFPFRWRKALSVLAFGSVCCPITAAYWGQLARYWLSKPIVVRVLLVFGQSLGWNTIRIYWLLEVTRNKFQTRIYEDSTLVFTAFSYRIKENHFYRSLSNSFPTSRRFRELKFGMDDPRGIYRKNLQIVCFILLAIR